MGINVAIGINLLSSSASHNHLRQAILDILVVGVYSADDCVSTVSDRLIASSVPLTTQHIF